MKLNESGRQKLEMYHSWQYIKHASLFQPTHGLKKKKSENSQGIIMSASAYRRFGKKETEREEKETDRKLKGTARKQKETEQEQKETGSFTTSCE